jgi:ectoine hydroxylase-related dioxygenase (phytanoyl-CoA dioxygenase family)
VPHDVYSGAKEVFNQRLGFLKIQGPHQDNWFGHSTGGINLWMAVSPVDRGNGLLIYQDRWSEEVPHDGNLKMPTRAPVGRPTNFQLSPGDLLFFHGEHLHSSEINITGNTRVVLTTRLCREKPNFKETSNISPWLQSHELPFLFRMVSEFKYR